MVTIETKPGRCFGYAFFVSFRIIFRLANQKINKAEKQRQKVRFFTIFVKFERISLVLPKTGPLGDDHNVNRAGHVECKEW